MKIGFPVLVLGLGAFAASLGTPHMLVTYDCKMGNPCKAYWQCDYIGIQGWRRFYPSIEPDQEQDCSGLMLFPLDWPPFVWHADSQAPKYRGLP
jgi:hypothetical protein